MYIYIYILQSSGRREIGRNKEKSPPPKKEIRISDMSMLNTKLLRLLYVYQKLYTQGQKQSPPQSEHTVLLFKKIIKNIQSTDLTSEH